MFGPVRVVIVDDTPSHLFCIGAGFAAAGIPCTPYWYDQSELSPKDKLKPKPAANGNEYLRVIFTDLNLEEKITGGLPVAINPVINVIEQLVSSDGGPYAVIFWTVMTEKIEDIRIELMDRLVASGIHLPIVIDELKKSSFLESPSKEHTGEEVLEKLYTEIFNKTDDLKEEVLKILSKYGLLLMISEWESRAMRAAGKSSNSLFSAAKLGVMGDEEITDVLKKVSALVSKKAVGELAKEMPARAYDAAMQNILVDSFSQSVNDEGYSKLVGDELQEVINSNITINNLDSVYSKLNAIFHLDTDVAGLCANNRGSVIDMSDAVANKIVGSSDDCCRWDEYFWKPNKKNIDVTVPKLSEYIRESIRDEITTISDQANAITGKASEIVNKAIESLRRKRSAKVKEKYQGLENEVGAFNKSLRWVLIEVGADCDHAQDKPRTLRYLVAVEVPSQYVDDYVYGGTKKCLRNDALRLFGPYISGGNNFYLLVSLKRFITWQHPKKFRNINVLYRLRKSLVDYILNHYATRSMRPGITEYKL